MPRLRTAAAATMFVIPIVAGGFLLEAPPARANARLLEQVLSLVSARYVDSLPPGVTYQKAAEGLIRELNDPYSELLTPKASEDFNRSTGGRYGGTGMLLGEQSPGVVVVDRVFPNTPAEDGGVREGDRVLAVDSVSTATVPFNRVSEMLRGTPGSSVTVTYGRPGVPTPIKLQFTRRVIHVPAVAYSGLLGDGPQRVGYVPLQTFNENAAEEVLVAVDSLSKAGATGIVLDMRDNGGGILDQALATSSLFLREGQEIVTVRYRSQPNEVLKSKGRHLALTIPLVVLVDGGSASATEIVAGALQDHDRALVIGTTSFGKGLVQSVYQLDGGYFLKMTTGKWYTPSGRTIHRERKLLPNGDFVEIHPDSLPKGKERPTFKSDAGRIVYGGGGIRPDVVVPDDTLATLERGFLIAIATKRQAINTILADYALELKGSVPRDFKAAPPAWKTELMRRLTASSAEIKIDPKYQTTAETFLIRDLENRVMRLSFGDAAAKARIAPEDHQLVRALDLLRQSTTQAQLLAAGARPK